MDEGTDFSATAAGLQDSHPDFSKSNPVAVSNASTTKPAIRNRQSCSKLDCGQWRTKAFIVFSSKGLTDI